MRISCYIILLPFLLLLSCDETNVNENVTILENGYYFDGDTMVHFSELIFDNIIIAINSKKTGVSGKRFNIDGKYVIPGLTDAHVHLQGSPTGKYEYIDPADNAHSSLLCGVTTVIDLFFDEDKCRSFKEKTGKEPDRYSTCLMSGPILTAPKGHGTEYGVETRTITSVKEAELITNQVIDNGMDVIKVVYQAHSYKHFITKAMLEAIVTEAHKRGVKVFVHVDVVQDALDCADVGADVLAHLPAGELTDETIQKLKKSGIVTIPTMAVIKSIYGGHDKVFVADSLLQKTAHRKYLDKFDSSVSPLFPRKELVDKYRLNLQLFIQYDLPLLAGTDAGNYAVFYGYSLHDELSEYVLCGMKPVDALKTATQNLKKIFPGIKTGAIRKGYNADLVVLTANPLQDISNTKRIEGVYHKGKPVKM